jgi:predicted ester cyclase
MSRADIEARLGRHKAAFARRDIDALVAEHAPDGTFESPAYGVVLGREAIRDVYRYWYEAFPDFMLTWEHALIDPPRASYFWTFEGTAAGPFFGQVQHGSKVTMIGASECLFSEAGIVSIRHVFDFSGVLIRAGVLKIRPG